MLSYICFSYYSVISVFMNLFLCVTSRVGNSNFEFRLKKIQFIIIFCINWKWNSLFFRVRVLSAAIHLCKKLYWRFHKNGIKMYEPLCLLIKFCEFSKLTYKQHTSVCLQLFSISTLFLSRDLHRICGLLAFTERVFQQLAIICIRWILAFVCHLKTTLERTAFKFRCFPLFSNVNSFVVLSFFYCQIFIKFIVCLVFSGWKINIVQITLMLILSKS